MDLSYLMEVKYILVLFEVTAAFVTFMVIYPLIFLGGVHKALW